MQHVVGQPHSDTIMTRNVNNTKYKKEIKVFLKVVYTIFFVLLDFIQQNYSLHQRVHNKHVYYQWHVFFHFQASFDRKDISSLSSTKNVIGKSVRIFDFDFCWHFKQKVI